MSGIRDQENIEELRKKLYDRSAFVPDNSRGHLTDNTVDVARGWDVTTPKNRVSTPVPEEIIEASTSPIAPTFTPAPSTAMAESNAAFAPKVKKARSFRLIIFTVSILIFLLAVGVSSFYMMMGGNEISTKNVTISVSAPISVPAGEEMDFQVSVTNQNTIAIENATLILNYPPGTKSADGGKDIYEERFPVDSIEPGEAKNIPLSIILFGEENEEREIKTEIEYRVSGSNGTFYKEADPVKIKINSAPLSLRVTGSEKIASGQDQEVTLVIKSNSPTSIKNVLINASYPRTWNFTKSTPEPSYGDNAWLIPEIKPESSVTIKINGSVSGQIDEDSEIQFSAGTPRSDNQFMMGAVLSKGKLAYKIERPFIDVGVLVNEKKGSVVTLSPGDEAEVEVILKNTLEESIYDLRLEILPKGNLISEDKLTIIDGLYDAGAKVIKYEASGMPELEEIKAGETRKFNFKVKADNSVATAGFTFGTKVFARRIGENDVSEDLIGSEETEVKYTSSLSLASQVGRGDDTFSDEGPIPPKVGETTTYTITLRAEAGVNDTASAVLTGSLPQYVKWLNKSKGDGSIEFSETTKQLRWVIGSIPAKTSKTMQIQVSILPSASFAGKTVSLMGRQDLKAIDRFTEENLSASAGALNTELSEEAGFEKGNGIVQD